MSIAEEASAMALDLLKASIATWMSVSDVSQFGSMIGGSLMSLEERVIVPLLRGVTGMAIGVPITLLFMARGASVISYSTWEES
jgi:hypothetical protein